MSRIIGLIFCCVIAGCSGPSEDAMRTADALRSTGTSTTKTASDNPVCALFSSSDAARYVGKPTAEAEESTGGCQWTAVKGGGSMNVQIVPARYYEKGKGTPGYRALPDVGTDGYVATYLNGWAAQAIVGKEAIAVSVIGDRATEASTIALLKEVIKRHGGSHG